MPRMHSLGPWQRDLSRWCWGAALLLALTGYSSPAEPTVSTGFSIRTWDTEKGLPSDDITALARTPDGYLWIGGAAGLARFDGIRFVLLPTNQLPGLRASPIAGLVVDDITGVLWVADRTGAFTRRRQGRFEDPGFNQPLRVGAVNSVAWRRNGTLWLGTEKGGVLSIDTAQGQATFVTNGLPAGPVTQILCGGQEQVWALANEKVVRLAGGLWREVGVTLPARAIAASRDGGLWVATVSGYRLLDRGARVFKFSQEQAGSELEPYPWAQDTLRSKITSLWEDPQGRLWAGTRNEGVFYWQAGAGWQRLTTEGPLAQLPITPMLEGDEGSLWFASQRGGLHRLMGSRVVTLRLPPAVQDSFILTTCAAADGSIWVGTDGAGAFRYREGQFEQETNGLTNLQVGVLFEDRQTNLWAGTWAGLHRWRDGRFERVTNPEPLTDAVLGLTEDKAENLWVCTGSGLVRLHGGEAKVFGKDEGIEHFYLRAVVEDAAGRICVAITDRGLYRLEGKDFSRVGANQWSGAARIRALLPDAGGALWIATSGEGLFRLAGTEFRHWSAADGLPDDVLHSLIKDADGNLWMSSNNGIFGCPLRDLESYQRGRDRPLLFWHLTPADGLETKVCSGAGQPVAARSADGRLWFPNQRSLAVFDPRQAQRGGRMWPAVIEEVMIDGVIHPAGKLEEITVNSPASRIEIHYTSPNLSTPEQLRFRHRLAGSEQNWVEAGDRRVVFYNQLPPGKYEFQVMAGGPDGQWHESLTGLKLEILPRWWERRSAQAALAICLLALVSGTVWSLERARSRRRLLRLEAQRATERERRRIAQDLHDDLGTSLTEINLMSELAARPSASAQEVKDKLGGIAEKSLEMVRALDEIVWAVNPRNDTLPNLVNYLCLFAQDFLRLSRIQCRLEVADSLPVVALNAEQRHTLYLVLKEVLANSVKHSGARELWLRISLKESLLTLAVEDDGCGFDAGQVRAGRNGLTNLQSRMTALGGSCAFQSRVGKGTMVKLEMPL